MFNFLKEALFGVNWASSWLGIAVVIGMVPEAITQLGLSQPPQWLRNMGILCTIISYLIKAFIQRNVQRKDIVK